MGTNVEAGRAFVREFYVRSELSAITTISNLKEFQTGTALLPPLEVQPGYIPSVQWDKCEKQIDPQTGRPVEVGVISKTEFRQDGMLILNCARGLNQGEFRLIGKQRPLIGPAVHLLPRFRIRFVNKDTRILRTRNPGWDKVGASVTVQLACDPSWQLSCDKPAEARWSLLPDYKVSADELSVEQTTGSVAYIQRLSTRSPSEEPHRVFGLVELLESFLRRSRPHNEVDLASLRICQLND